jgi:hypothetical protein
MSALQNGECIGKLERGPLDGETAIVKMTREFAPPATLDAVVVHHCGEPNELHVYRLDTERMVLEADGTEVYVYLYAETGTP